MKKRQIFLLLPLLAGICFLVSNPVFAQSMFKIEPGVEIDNQPLVDGTVTVKSVQSTDTGWLVIHQDKDGKPGPIIGYTSIQKGINDNVRVSIDKEKLTERLIAMLHIDAGKKEVFEFPGPDTPVMLNNKIVMEPFDILKANITRLDISAKNWVFEPNALKVKKGSTVELHLLSNEGTHGFALPAFGINEKMDKGKEAIVRFVATKSGQFPFHCSIYCGPGHREMKGQLTVEE